MSHGLPFMHRYKTNIEWYYFLWVSWPIPSEQNPDLRISLFPFKNLSPSYPFRPTFFQRHLLIIYPVISQSNTGLSCLILIICTNFYAYQYRMYMYAYTLLCDRRRTGFWAWQSTVDRSLGMVSKAQLFYVYLFCYPWVYILYIWGFEAIWCKGCCNLKKLILIWYFWPDLTFFTSILMSGPDPLKSQLLLYLLSPTSIISDMHICIVYRMLKVKTYSGFIFRRKIFSVLELIFQNTF